MAKKKSPIVKISFYFRVESEQDGHVDLDTIKSLATEKLEEEIPSSVTVRGSFWNSDRVKVKLVPHKDIIENLRKDSSK